jgi:hypothetical protein
MRRDAVALGLPSSPSPDQLPPAAMNDSNSGNAALVEEP